MKTPMCLYLGLIAIAILLTFDVLLHRSESFSLYTSLSYAAKARAELKNQNQIQNQIHIQWAMPCQKVSGITELEELSH